MNQIWPGLIWLNPSDQILEQRKKKVLGDLLWDWGRGEGSPMHCFCFFLCVFVLVLVFFADSRWLTLQ